MADRKLGFLVEEVCPCHVDGDLDDFFLGILNRGGHADDNLLVGDEDVEVGLSAEQLAEVDLGGDAVARGELVEGEEVLGTHTEDDGLADIGLESSLLGFGDLQLVVVENGDQLAALFRDLDIEEVHLGGADEAGDEEIARGIVQHLRGIELLDDAVLHDDDAVAHGHSLGLVVSDVDEGGVKAAVQAGDLAAHGGTELCVQVGQRLVKEEDRRITDHGAAQSDTLTLTAGQSLGLTLKQMLQVKDLGGFVDALVNLVLGDIAQGQTESDVLVNGHMGVQCVVLENHGDVTVFRGDLVDQSVADVQLAAGDGLQTRDHTQGGGLAAAGGADQNDEFLVLDLKVEVGDDGLVCAVIDLGNVFEANGCHRCSSCIFIVYTVRFFCIIQ